MNLASECAITKIDHNNPQETSQKNVIHNELLNIIPKSNIMANKIGIILGYSNSDSIAWAITKEICSHGAQVIMTYQDDRFKSRVEALAKIANAKGIIRCDIQNEEDIENLFNAVENITSKVDFIVHSLAFSDRNELSGMYINTSKENFLKSMYITCYSFTALARKAYKIMNKGGAMLTLTYHGAQKVMPNYNVMGVCKAALEASVRYLAEDLGKYDIRVNAMSAGPMRTLAASGISDFNYILKWNALNSPLRRNTNYQDIGGAALFLLSTLSSGVTGEILYVDSGYHVVGMKAVDAPDITKV